MGRGHGNAFRQLEQQTKQVMASIKALNKKKGGLEGVLSRLQALQGALASGRVGRNPLSGACRQFVDAGYGWDHPAYGALEGLENAVDRLG